jgi:hypothetical protein
MAQQTAINWLRKKLEETYDKEGKLPLAYTFSLLNKAEQMEKEQIVNAHGDKGWAKPIIDENGVPQKDGITFGMTTGEQYYNETYGK